MATMLAKSDLPPAMEGLVEDTPLRNPNLLTYNQVYCKVGSTRVLQAEPAVLNFGGYTLGQVYSQTLIIRNVRARGARFHILAPNTPFFKATCSNKKGLLAPGMSEEVVVEFCPSHYRYYYDCIRVHSEDENLLIPIHAYPVANETLFPTRVDFGRGPVGQEIVKTHTLECKVPVDFEFEIVETRPNPCFRVEPSRGVIPGHGTVSVTTSFCPLSFKTEEAVIEVTGGGWPGAARDRALGLGPGGGRVTGSAGGGGGTAAVAAAAAVNGRLRSQGDRRVNGHHQDEDEEDEDEDEEDAEAEEVQPANGRSNGGGGGGRVWRRSMTMEELDGTMTLKLGAKGLPVNLGGGTLKGGAGNGDSYTAYLDLQRRERVMSRDCRTEGPIRSRPPKLPPPRGETAVNGVIVPDSLLLTAAEWRLIEGSDWAKRTRARDLFMRAVWRVVRNMRLQKRLERIKEVLAHLGYDKQRLAEEAANPVLLVKESDRPGSAPTRYLRPEMVRVRPLPLYRDVLFQPHPPQDVSHYTDFDELAPFQLKTPLEYRLLGYNPEEFPGLTPYLPPLLDQPLLGGACEEVAAAGERIEPSGVVPPLQDFPPLPDACKNMPYITLEIGARYGVERIFAAPEPSYDMGYDMDYVIQPRLYDIYESGAHEAPASGSVRALRGGPALSDTWLVRQDTWAVQLGEEVVLRLMSGPEAEDLPEDLAEDDDKPKIAPQVPTDEQLARYLPRTSRTEETTTTAAAAGPAAATASKPASPLAAGQAAAATAAAAVTQQQLQSPPPSTSSSPTKSADPAAPVRYRLVRDRHAAQLEAAKQEAHLASLSSWEQKLAEYNNLLRKPCYFALHL
ncbi:hypothetical protein VOLCADRAFT_121366 [Volvox carteri f. nagariensis]|uniref:HYDIN/VesB/CFA65-like Ig-like domain-containing protein n=1 Tax=Volvox carteri f. nagariensis TaxID=3068 RepID=D8U8K9_VOLCA|nr:uncharacterized protein VOLCADRAFT_121366 [Volvox carteri f. nagariensis]EFJ43939.1 hypothetical protein VOLCADRAFT_121366 [Volvox carteri f. nagariensis]|eukprot:XP_002954951.1 hypothetical protein VOLCADRAFT_121366 [Volvox carteri f. nagariensis]